MGKYVKVPEVKRVEFTDEEARYLIEQVAPDVLAAPFCDKADSGDRVLELFKKKYAGLSPFSDNLPSSLRNDAWYVYRQSKLYRWTFNEIMQESYQETLVNGFSEAAGRDMTVEEIDKLSPEETVSLLKKYAEGKNNEIDIRLLAIQYRANGITLSDEKRTALEAVFGKPAEEPEEEADVPDEENESGEDEAQTAQKAPAKKHKKKLTAREKEEKNRLANERKQKEKEEELRRQEELAGEAFSEEDEEETALEDIKEDADIGAPESNDAAEEKEEVRPEMSQIESKPRYVGYVSIVNNSYSDFYNFEPIGRLTGYGFEAMRESEVSALLAKSNYNNINLYYNFDDVDDARFMQEHFYSGQLVVLELDEEDLERCYITDPSQGQNAYKIKAVEAFERKHILRFLSSEGYYRLVNQKQLDGDIRRNNRVNLRDDIDTLYPEGEKILVKLDENLFAGPYDVKFSRVDNKFNINPQAMANSYLLTGYGREDCTLEYIENYVEFGQQTAIREPYYKIKPGAQEQTFDVISQETLIEGLSDIASEIGTENVKGDSLDALVDTTKSPVLSGKAVTVEIRASRVERMKDLLSSGEAINASLNGIADALYKLVLNNKDSEQANKILELLFASHSDLPDRIQGVRMVQTQIESKKKELEDLDRQKEEAKKAISEESIARQERQVSESLKEKKEELDNVSEVLGVAKETEALQQKKDRLEKEIGELEAHKQRLSEDTRGLESGFDDMIKGYSSRVADISFDGYMSSRMLAAAAEWNSRQDTDRLLRHAEELNNKALSDLPDEDLVQYLVYTVQRVRPNYTRNVIVNLVTCAMQGFLTVLSGEPGCGKTSICNILAKTLGLEEPGINRYVPVSVERGWTSKRDFVGYYNPLTKTFEESNRQVFDALQLLDKENEQGIRKMPYLILLDEANLSAMEYYWADFMNVCDDLSDNHSINLGNTYNFEIPETLHFLATINNDNTTEPLSPRLLDRAWIITLPRIKNATYRDDAIRDGIQLISWADLNRTFRVQDGDDISMDKGIERIYQGVSQYFDQADLSISPRSYIAMQKYWHVASRLMTEDEYSNDAGVVALDYAIAQKILPRVKGAGAGFEDWLKELVDFCGKNNLRLSKDLLDRMISRGNKIMNFYNFFS